MTDRSAPRKLAPHPPDGASGDLRLEGVHKSYGPVKAVTGVDLSLAERETLALLGPSGCGKSTLLRLVAGLELPDSGRVLMGDDDITALPPQRRSCGMVFQDYALFPHLDVGRNIGFGLVELGWNAAARRRRVAELLELVGLAGLERRRVDALSGGQQQRVALARALAPQPDVLLLDEPLSNLDQNLREDLKDELRRILTELPIRAIYVTHDQGEALTVADRVAVMRAGRILQQARPRDVLERPKNSWVARFMGHDNVYEAARLAGVPAAPHGSAALLRADLISLAEAPGTGTTRADAGAGPRPVDEVSATVRAARREGLAWRLELELEPARLPVVWRGFARELGASASDLGTSARDGNAAGAGHHPLESGAPRRPGDRLRLRIPTAAWVPLEDE